jgi:hypothetical protein
MSTKSVPVVSATYIGPDDDRNKRQCSSRYYSAELCQKNGISKLFLCPSYKHVFPENVNLIACIFSENMVSKCPSPVE